MNDQLILDPPHCHREHATEVRITRNISCKALVLICEDNGSGIPAVDKERIFDRGVCSITGHGLFLVREVLGLTLLYGSVASRGLVPALR